LNKLSCAAAAHDTSAGTSALEASLGRGSGLTAAAVVRLRELPRRIGKRVNRAQFRRRGRHFTVF
jgi:hypothetical protein